MGGSAESLVRSWQPCLMESANLWQHGPASSSGDRPSDKGIAETVSVNRVLTGQRLLHGLTFPDSSIGWGAFDEITAHRFDAPLSGFSHG